MMKNMSRPNERQALNEQLKSRGGFSIMMPSYYDTMWNKTAKASIYDFWVKKVRSRMTDPVKRDTVAPLERFQWIGTKRPNLEMDYYEMLDRPNGQAGRPEESPYPKSSMGAAF
ncbi:Baeyer-Villiger monooxygenase [Tolypocladium ophioglossoides CBS 100239]|uniref:Baeyer-Villiger monooxygenase n=1 Tax=Tolypocladium ophioglossoides (strain CBS 100239) TaxID=1163406 RepID=A0A0L0ND56_TOLOC|nr:Baeyer-Villiger monooxygenase [Tolypocladium ophioglossoides CBS 100239]